MMLYVNAKKHSVVINTWVKTGPHLDMSFQWLTSLKILIYHCQGWNYTMHVHSFSCV